MEKLKMAILGAGGIAHMMAKTVAALPQVEIYAIASRDSTRAEAFAQQYGIPKAYGSYEELVQDEAVELVYIASPHSHHAEHACLCITHGRPILCEKAFTGNARQAKEVLELAKKNKVFITEAVWPRYTPHAKTLQKLVQDEVVGHVSMLDANFGFDLRHIDRMTTPELAGGALLDLGVYSLTFAFIAFGSHVTSVTSSAILSAAGVDEMNSIALQFEEGRMASVVSNMTAAMANTGTLYGEKGYITVPKIHNFGDIRVFDSKGNQLAVYEQPPQITGYEYEVLACVDALHEGRLECPDMPHAETLRIMELFDTLRAGWGMRYPFD